MTATGRTLLDRLRGVNGSKYPPLLLDDVVFGGSPPNEECRQERAELLNTLRAMAREYGGTPESLWKFLLDEHERYDTKRDGTSEAMTLVENVEALRGVELAIRGVTTDRAENVQ